MQYLKFYILYLPLFGVITHFLIKYLNNKTNEERLEILKILSLVALVFHIIKPLFFPYNNFWYGDKITDPDIFNFPGIFRKITFENICAVSALLFFPVLFMKNKYVLDYFVIFGFLGGFLALIYPAEVMMGAFDSIQVNYEMKLFSFDTIRFYTVHYLLFVISYILIHYKIHELDSKRMFYFPISLMLLLTLLYTNEYVLYKIGWLNDIENYIIANDPSVGTDFNLFNDRNYRNFSFVFGIPDHFKEMGAFIDILVPKFMKPNNEYVPIFRITLPAFIYGPLIYLGFSKYQDKYNFEALMKKEEENRLKELKMQK